MLDRAFLDLRLLATLGTTNADGSLLLTPLWYLFEDGRLYLPTFAKSRKVRNIAARPSATVLIDQRRAGGNRWVSATGTAEILRGAEAQAINARVRARYLTDAGEAAYGQVLDSADDVAIVLTPDAWKSWQPTLLQRTVAAHGRPEAVPEDWFHQLD